MTMNTAEGSYIRSQIRRRAEQMLATFVTTQELKETKGSYSDTFEMNAVVLSREELSALMEHSYKLGTQRRHELGRF